MRKILILTGVFFLLAGCNYNKDRVFIEAEAFADYGGWVHDAQFIDQMGSPYLMAHGLGVPVEDAVTSFEVNEPGIYYVAVRTFNWVAPHLEEGISNPFTPGESTGPSQQEAHATPSARGESTGPSQQEALATPSAPEESAGPSRADLPAPGLFRLVIDGIVLDTVFGHGPDAWGWAMGGTVELESGSHELRLRDLTGFNGRVDAIFLSKEPYDNLPNNPYRLFQLRTRTGAIPDEIQDEGFYDMVVVGGGLGGISAAVTAARLGLKTALIQNRPVLGGNNSSEVRVHLVGKTDRNLYPALGNIVRALDDHHPPNAAEGNKYQDSLKLQLVKDEPNLDLFLNTHMNWLEIDDGKIQRVYAINTRTGQQHRFHGTYFADCTGDGTLGKLAGADYRYGRESREETGEPSAPEVADSLTMGSSNLWRSTKKDIPSSFPEVPWALPFTEDYFIDAAMGTWRWESGFDRDIIEEAEFIRDHNLRAVFGNWSFLKNNLQEKYSHHSLDWVAFVAGKRESRRLMGDVILSELDIINNVEYEDAAVTLTWGIDIHFADTLNSQFYPGQEFISWYDHPKHEPYHIPYRCLYSRNIDNLFMAGRNISVTHFGLGSARVMNTTGMMGEVVGMAASICVEEKCYPREVYQEHLDRLKGLMMQGI